MSEKACAHCPDSIGKSFAIVTFTTVEVNEYAEETSSKRRLYLCENCMTALNKRVSEGTLTETEKENAFELIDFDQDNGVLTKELTEFHIAYDAFFQCDAYKSYVAVVTGPHEKWGLALDWLGRRQYKKKRHFNLQGVMPGTILKIRGKRLEEDIHRFIIVVGVEKHVLYFKTISEDQAIMAFSGREVAE